MKPNIAFLLRLTADERKGLDELAADQVRSANSVLRAMIRRELETTRARQSALSIDQPTEPRKAA